MTPKEVQDTYKYRLTILRMIENNEKLGSKVEALASEGDKILMSSYERGILQPSDSIKQSFDIGMSVGYASAIHDVLGLIEQRGWS